MPHAVAKLLLLLALPAAATAQSAPPKTWVDRDTGHRVIRVTDEPGSSGFYFNNNAYTPDHKTMIYSAPDGIHGLDLATMKTRLIVPNPPRPAADPADPTARYRGGVRAIVAGNKTNSIFYTLTDPATKLTSIYKADVYTNAITRLATLPPNSGGVSTINADETLAAGSMNDGPAIAPDYGTPAAQAATSKPSATQAGNLVQPDNKGEMMERRLASRQPVILFTISLTGAKPVVRRTSAGRAVRTGPGGVRVLLHSTDWIGHLLFSPKDPSLLMYCHEGPWQKVDRIWMIRTDGTHNTLIHKRRIAMEIAGHEFWGLDGETIWYDWQPIKGQDFYLAGYNLQTGQRTAYHMDRNDWSIHFNLTRDLDVFTGDGGDPGQVAKAPDGDWIELFHPQLIRTDGALNDPTYFQPGIFHPEHLVNMAQHNYKLEPNVRFSPDKSMVFFTSNMFGPSYVFAVETAKAVDPPPADVLSTPELATKFNPGKPPSTNPNK